MKLDNLKEKYPKIFKKNFYFECNEGWYELLFWLCHEITWNCEELGYKIPKAIQVKEKFGSLRFYTDFCEDEIHDIITKYEKKSETICETCGNKNSKIVKIRGWLFNCCKKCKKEIIKKGNL